MGGSREVKVMITKFTYKKDCSVSICKCAIYYDYLKKNKREIKLEAFPANCRPCILENEKGGQ